MNTQSKQYTLLIVEDESPLLGALVDKFSYENFSVLQAKNGEEGLIVALKEQPDLILLDIIMPVMDGMTMLKKLRETSDWGKRVPVILLTNLAAGDQIMNDVIRDEPAYYLVKTDWKIEEVVAKVRERLETPHS